MNNLLFSKTHEWVKFQEDGTALIGLTDFAQQELGDIVFVNLCEEGDTIEAGVSFGDVESVKAVSDIVSPLSATVVKVNEDVLSEPERINSDPYGTWLLEVNEVTGKEDLLSQEDYLAFTKEGH